MDKACYREARADVLPSMLAKARLLAGWMLAIAVGAMRRDRQDTGSCR